MIQFNTATGNWEFNTLIGSYLDTSAGEDTARVEYTNNRRYLEDRVRNWPSFSRLIVQQFNPTEFQAARLNEMNAANVPQSMDGYARQYVEHGYIDIAPDADVGHTYLNTIGGRPENQQARSESHKRKIIANIAARRWRHEVGGLSINGFFFGTDDRSKLLMLSQAFTASLAPGTPFAWKTPQGSIQLTATQLMNIWGRGQQFLSDCFMHEGVLSAQVMASDTPEAIDISAGWPDTDVTMDFG